MLKPYLAVSGGVRFLESNTPTFSVPAAQVTLRDVPFYDSSTVATAAAGLGVRYDVNSRFSIGVETGPRFQSKPDDLTTLRCPFSSRRPCGSKWRASRAGRAVPRPAGRTQSPGQSPADRRAGRTGGWSGRRGRRLLRRRPGSGQARPHVALRPDPASSEVSASFGSGSPNTSRTPDPAPPGRRSR
jgi:hypothetical protein